MRRTSLRHRPLPLRASSTRRTAVASHQIARRVDGPELAVGRRGDEGDEEARLLARLVDVHDEERRARGTRELGADEDVGDVDDREEEVARRLANREREVGHLRGRDGRGRQRARDVRREARSRLARAREDGEPDDLVVVVVLHHRRRVGEVSRQAAERLGVLHPVELVLPREERLHVGPLRMGEGVIEAGGTYLSRVARPPPAKETQVRMERADDLRGGLEQRRSAERPRHRAAIALGTEVDAEPIPPGDARLVRLHARIPVGRDGPIDAPHPVERHARRLPRVC